MMNRDKQNQINHKNKHEINEEAKFRVQTNIWICKSTNEYIDLFTDDDVNTKERQLRYLICSVSAAASCHMRAKLSSSRCK